MKSGAFFAALLVFSFLGAATPRNDVVAAAPRPTHPCAALAPTTALTQPPNVEMWKAPVDASGEHELILAAHRDGALFCYHYVWDGREQVTAPAIRVRPGEHFALRIVNDLTAQSPGEKVASTAIPTCRPMPMPPTPTLHWVGYLNHIIDDRYMSVPDVDTNLHLHGFQGPADQEDIFLSTLSTPMRACEYRITIPQTQPPGTYFYHPHVHGMSDDEVAGGLDGAWIVDAARPQLPYSAEHVVIVRYQIPFELDNDVAPDGSGFVPAAAAHEAALRVAPAVKYDPFNPPPWPLTYPMRVGDVGSDPTGCNGTGPEGVISIDGATAPATLTIPAAQTQLLRIINGTSDSPKLFRIRDSRGVVQAMRVVGIDGVPVSGDMRHPLSQYIPMNRIMVSPMGRADVLVSAAAGTTLTLSSEHFCEGADAFYQMRHDLLRIQAIPTSASGTIVDARPVLLSQTPAARLIAYARSHPQLIRRRAITFTEYALPRVGKIPVHQAYYITDTTNPNFHEHPFWPVYERGATVPSNPDVVVHQGAIEEWYLINTTMEAHAFHIHQMAFVIEKNADGIPIMADTAFVPVGTLLRNRKDANYPLVKPSITRILLDFRHVPRGTFVFHCHMLFHEDHGMMATIRVE